MLKKNHNNWITYIRVRSLVSSRAGKRNKFMTSFVHNKTAYYKNKIKLVNYLLFKNVFIISTKFSVLYFKFLIKNNIFKSYTL